MTHQEAVASFAAGASVPRRAIEGLSDHNLDALPVPGTWSIRQIVVHLLDSDLAAAHRMKRIIAEERPLLIAYDETAFAKSCGYGRVDVAEACTLFELNRRHMAAVLQGLPDAAFAREGVHNQRGLVTLGEIVRMYIDHLEGHMAHLRRKRELLGKPLAW